jgi:predicted Zn-dependent peptidase
MRVVVNPDDAVPMAAVNIWYDVGSRDETPGNTGWAHLFEHLMFQGSANVASGEHLNLLQSVGGSANATTSFDRTNYFETVPVGALDLALWMEADRLATLADHLDEHSLATQKQVVKEERRQRYDDVPYGDSLEQLLGLAFPADHPYGHSVIGSMADVDAATPQLAADFFRKYYRPQNAVISIVGDVSEQAAFAKVEEYFGHIPGGEKNSRTPSAPLPPLQGLPTTELRSRVPADSLQLVWRLPVRDSKCFDAATLAIGILTDGPSSRLERLLIRERGKAAGVAGGVLDLVDGTSMALVSALAMPDAGLEEIESEIGVELSRLAEDGPTDSEMRRALAKYSSDWLTALAQFEVRADDFSEYTALFDDPTLVNSRMEKVMALSCADVRDAARDWLLPEHRGTLRYFRQQEDDHRAGSPGASVPRPDARPGPRADDTADAENTDNEEGGLE